MASSEQMSINIPQTLENARKLMAASRFADAENLCRQIISTQPSHPQALHILGQLALQAGRPDLAVPYLQKSLQLDPRNAIACFDLANAIMKVAPVDQAIPIYHRAIQLQPTLTEVYVNLGIALALQEQFEDSIAAFRTAIAQRPNFPEAHDGLGLALRLSGQLHEAASEHRKAIELRPTFPAAHSNLGLALVELGEMEPAIAAFREALRLAPNFRDAHTALLYNLHFCTPYNADQIHREHQSWNRSFAQPRARLQQFHKNDRDPNRPLRVGYVSADFRQHAVSFFIENLLAGHNEKNVEVFCYADQSKPDEVTQRLQSHVRNWRDITSRSDQDVDRMIRHDQIDILVDLSGHTLGNRLLLFAAKPAPVQLTYLGYIDTTGLDTIDYRLTDSIADPPGATERFHSEKLLQLPATFACYHPPTDAQPPGPLPALTASHVTFASFAILQKLNPPLLECWADLLSKVPNSHLIIVAKGLQHSDRQQSIRQTFEQRAIASDRLTLFDLQSFPDYLNLHQRIDIILDSFPVNGHTVTCHGLWMGVPVVTLAGQTYCQRLTASVLTNLNLTNLIANSPAQYINIAIKLATDLSRLANLRATLRQILAASTIMDSPRFVQDVETAYRTIWHHWCENVAIEPKNIQSQLDSAASLAAAGQYDEAIATCRTALALAPDNAQAHFTLGTLNIVRGQLDYAIDELNRALALRPDYPEAHNNLGNAFLSKGLLTEAITHFQHAQFLQPNSTVGHRNLGGAMLLQGNFDAAITALNQALALHTDDADVHCQLASAFKSIGDIEQAISHFDRVLKIQPNHLLAADSRLFTLNFRHGADPQTILAEHKSWNDRFAKPIPRITHRQPTDASPNRLLRVGYISPDFQDHVLGMNLLPLFQNHDHANFHVTCYSNSAREDSVTKQFQTYADRWRPIFALPDAAVARQIAEDQIDILVDLTLHSRDNRLLALAAKPAHIQVTFAGYPGTTGLETIDYRLTDPHLDPPSNDAYYSEQSIRLPHSFWCYQPLGDQPPVNALSALSAKTITFGCLCTFAKVNDAVLHLWSHVLQSVPDSRLLLLAPQGEYRKQICAKLAVDPTRVEFFDRQPRRKYLELYHRIDISLDTFPYNGHTTSLDSLWMGVPVVTLTGQTAVSRAGFSQASNLNLLELVAHAPEEFVRIAVKLANDLPHLATLRSTLRQRMIASPLMDAVGFARGIEAVYQQMWRSKKKPPPT
jgi:predicted O-linked N-acetylglucosamine transferase (SPINDLY family)